MIPPFSAAMKSLHEQAIDQIILATAAAEMNEQARAKTCIQQAKQLADMISRKMKAMGLHKEAVAYAQNLDDHINRVWSIAQKRISADRSIQKTEEIACKCTKKGDQPKACQCGGTQQIKKSEELAKGPLNPHAGLPSLEKETLDPKVSYKMFHELAPAHQKDVQKKHQGSDHSRYAYAVDRQSGNLANSPRIPLPPSYAIRAMSKLLKDQKPEHQKGAFVEIDDPSHHAHGKKGVVHGSNPNVPSQLKVQIGATENHSVYVEPSQVKLGKARTRIEKAIQTAFNIRKAFFK